MTEQTKSSLQIRFYPDPILMEIAKEVDIDSIKTEEFQQIIDEMFKLMKETDGVGLAAPQIGQSERFFTVLINKEQFVFINPAITPTSNQVISEREGCLSFPGITGAVSRPESCTIKALDRNGNETIIEASGLLARVAQHENDHLDGKLFINNFSTVDRAMSKKKLKMLKQLHQMGGISAFLGQS